MLILTDRPREAPRYQQIFGAVLTCVLVPLDAALLSGGGLSFIVCHTNLTNACSRYLLSLALRRHRTKATMRVMFLVADCSGAAHEATMGMGVPEVVPEDASIGQLLFTIKRGAGSSSGERDAGAIEENHTIVEAGQALSQMMNEAACGATVLVGVLNCGADAILASVKETDI